MVGYIATYDATSGTVKNANFIQGIGATVSGIAVSGNTNTLYVTSYGGTTVGTYDATTETLMNANFVTGLLHPYGLADQPRTSPLLSGSYFPASN
jgi:hypothetical protein